MIWKWCDIRSDRRDYPRSDDVAARAPWRGEELGLSVLLAARPDLHAPCLDASRIPRRGASVAGLAHPRCRRQSGPDSDRLRRWWGALVAGNDRSVACRLREFLTGADRKRRRPATADRRPRRGYGCDVSSTRGRLGADRTSSSLATHRTGISGNRLARSRRGNLGGARRTRSTSFIQKSWHRSRSTARPMSSPPKDQTSQRHAGARSWMVSMRTLASAVSIAT